MELSNNPTHNKKPAIYWWLAGCCLLIIIIIIIIAVWIFSLATPTNTDQINYQTQINPLTMVDLEIQTAQDLHLESVQLTELENGILEIRTPSPYNVSPEAIAASSAYIFSSLYPELPATYQTYRLILTVNHIDSLLIESSGQDVAQLSTGEIDQTEFVSRLSITNLIE